MAVTTVFRCDACGKMAEVEGKGPPDEWTRVHTTRQGVDGGTMYHACSWECAEDVFFKLIEDEVPVQMQLLMPPKEKEPKVWRAKPPKVPTS
jgi:hypothetical protein